MILSPASSGAPRCQYTVVILFDVTGSVLDHVVAESGTQEITRLPQRHNILHCACLGQTREHFKECKEWEEVVYTLWERVGNISGEING